MIEWRPVVGYEGKYEVSNDGRVRSFARYPEGQELKPWTSPLGHKKVALHQSGTKSRWVHKLVMDAFVGPLPKGMTVRHLNGIGSDNRLENLAYGTYSENNFDRVKHGKHHNAKKTHCKNGHEFTPENTQPQNAKTGQGRRCVACAGIRSAEQNKRNRKGAMKV